MKSRISSSKAAIIRKDITRFAPLWGLYLVGLLLVMLTTTDAKSSYYAAKSMEESLTFFLWVNLFFGALSAQLLFGDLFQSKLCNALHAMPVSRKSWFFCHVTSGFLFSLVPNLITACILLPRLGECWYVGFLWLGILSLQYLFFFGIAVFSVFCTGNRFAMAAVYALIHGGSVLVYALVAVLYEPLMYGVVVSMDPFLLLCPLAWLSQGEHFFLLTKYSDVAFYGCEEQWLYLLCMTVVGILLLLTSLLLYRRRKLECAGNFVAVRPLRPVIVLIITLTAGVLLAMFGALFEANYLVFLGIGLTVGYFAAQMLTLRTVKVFHWKKLVSCVLIALTVYGSIGLANLDVLGIVSYVPEKDQVKSVSIEYGYNLKNTHIDEETIEMTLQLHQDILNGPRLDRGMNLELVYTLKNGRTVKRTYSVEKNSAEGHILRNYFSSVYYVVGTEDFELLKEKIFGLQFERQIVPVPKAWLQELLDAIRLDCEEGNMAEPWCSGPEGVLTLEFRGLPDIEVPFYYESQHIRAWLRKYQLLMFEPDRLAGYKLPMDPKDGVRQIEATEADWAYIADLLDHGAWNKDTTNCASDYLLYVQKYQVTYHTECGTFNDTENQIGLTLSEEQRTKVNAILGVE